MPDTDFATDVTQAVLEPRNVEDARQAIQQTRERISATLDAIEGRIEETRQQIRHRADVLSPIRERITAAPVHSLAIAAGVGLALGLLSGGRRHEAEKRARRPARGHARRIGRAQRPRSRHERHAFAAAYRRHEREPHGERPSTRQRMLDRALTALAAAISEGVSSRIRRRIAA